jgi:signal transduction histidine kinase
VSTVNVEIGELPGEIPEAHRTCVYRVVQEALTNCARHARARQIRIAVAGGGEGIRVSVQDDGTGFEPARVRGRGLGLIGIEERVMELGGELTVRSKAPSGTVLTARVPLPQKTVKHEHPSTVG